MVHTLEDGLWDWKLFYWHASLLSLKFWDLLGLSPQEEIPHIDWLNLVHPADAEQLQIMLSRVEHEGVPVTFDLRFWTCSAEYQWFCVRAAATLNPEGETTHLSGWIRNIQQERTARELSQQRENVYRQRQCKVAVDSLTGGVAHEFNNVLQIVRGFASFAKESVPEDNPAQSDLDEIITTTDRAANLVNRLNEFTRYRKEDVETIDVGEVLAGLETLLEATLSNKNQAHSNL